MDQTAKPFTITALVSDGTTFGGDYFKIIARSSNPNVEEHMSRLIEDGYTVLSVKSRPYDEYTDNFHVEIQDNQGNMNVVDDKRVRHASHNDGDIE